MRGKHAHQALSIEEYSTDVHRVLRAGGADRVLLVGPDLVHLHDLTLLVKLQVLREGYGTGRVDYPWRIGRLRGNEKERGLRGNEVRPFRVLGKLLTGKIPVLKCGRHDK
uniref:Uncharacterized protein n=1 Tax=uncultured virus TaxID=340016 RepID=D5L2J5_9VIRU|nr:hypothetical protein [uncultured virus]